MFGQMREPFLRFWKKLRARWQGRANAAEIREVRCLVEHVVQKAARESQLSAEEQQVVARIREETARQNRNNVTRTTAYWNVYRRLPELHWALLAHMVSRNGGYNMTDLRGDLIARAMEAGEAERLFQFLERANDLIFGDAYPQLLLYEESKRRGEQLFHLLPAFGVSRFMAVVWERFWETGDAELLTLALVVNEQNFIEERVVRQERYRAVVESFEFQAQTLLNLTQVVFPYETARGAEVRLAGVTVDTFLSLTERIDTGRQLYAILFGVREVHEGVLRWAERTPHTASRADYWPEMYTEHPGEERWDRPRLDAGRLVQGAPKLYSPQLSDAWPDVQEPEPPGGSDWCRGGEMAEELYGAKSGRGCDITDEYCNTLMLVERAVLAEAMVKRGE